jgi:iron complex outermembrane receptor protein
MRVSQARSGRLCLTISSLALAVPAAGQVAEVPADSDENPPAARSASEDLSEIVVTALRRETELLKTPVAVTVLSNEQLDARGITNPTQLSQEVPNLFINRSNAGYIQATIRGVSSQDITERGDSSVGFLFDGVPIARAQALDTGLYDLERTEVLRGPQGTLFGRNTTAGVINFVTKQPTDDFEAGLRATIGNYRTVITEGYVNVPVNEKLALRFAGLYDSRESFLREGTTNPALPIPLPPSDSLSLPKYNDNISVRGTLRFDATDNLRIVISGDYADLGGGRYDFVSQRNFFDFPAQPSPPFPPGSVDASKPTFGDRSTDERLTMPFALPFDLERDEQSWGVRSEISWTLGDFAIYYLGSHRQHHRAGQIAFSLFDIPLRTNPDDRYEQNSHELRASYDNAENFQVQVGAIYFNERNRIGGPVNFGALSPFVAPIFGVTGPTTTLQRSLDRNAKTDSWAIFSQGTYSISPALRLTLGARYTNDQKSGEGFDESRAGPVFNPATDARFLNLAEIGFDRVTWRAGLDYDLAPQTLAFLTVSTGYKAGGFNDGCVAGSVGSSGTPCVRPVAADSLYYQPETLTAYEGGLKGQIDAIGLGYQLTAFHYDYKNLQLLRVTTDLQAVSRFENAATARNTGVEFESLWRLDARTSLTLGGTWLDTELGDYQPLGPTGPNFAGRPLERAPEFTATARLRHTRPLLSGNITFAVGTRFSDSYFIYDYSSAVVFRQPSFFKSDALVEFSWAEDRLSLAAFVNNIEDYVEVGGIQNGSRVPGIGLIAGSAVPGQPRTWGLRAGVKF